MISIHSSNLHGVISGIFRGLKCAFIEEHTVTDAPIVFSRNNSNNRKTITFSHKTPKSRDDMMEKKTILNEMFTRERIYIDEKVDMTIKTLSEEEEIPDNCPKCKHELTDVYSRPEEQLQCINAFDLIVLKCQECNQLYAFWVMSESPDDTFTEEIKDEHVVEGRIIETGQMGRRNRSVFPKKFIEAYKKETSNPNNVNERLNQLVNTKLSALHKAGIGLDTINYARNKVISYLRNENPHEKNLTTLLAAAIYVTANGVTTHSESWQHRGEGISERKLEEIFGVTRKTLRKWAKAMQR